MSLTPLTLEGRFVRLEPLAASHGGEFEQIQDQIDEPVSKFNMSFEHGDVGRWFRDIVNAPIEQALTFAVRRLSDGQIVGSTRYHAIDLPNQSLEVGGTWYVRSARGTFVNPECKRLLLNHAFEDLNLNRVQLKCDSRNAHSRNAMLKMGAKEEGTLRRHSIYPSGYVRDAIFFSVIREEWPDVKRGLTERLARFG
ncbi:GNAT family N-acetyltransferase [Pendulispora rubella]|uniref:GNAT family N-acetyltransferase n=1 Tax=Pendulispora rubella TaxID=2741070 RepID=A0ABZ2KUQ4_9BACT